MAVFGTIQQKSMVGYLLILLVMLLMGGLYVQAYRYYLNTAMERKKTSLTQLTLEQILDDSYIAYISQQHFIATGQAADETAFQNSMSQLNRRLEKVGRLIENEPQQIRHYKKLATVIHTNLKQLPQRVKLSGSTGKTGLIATENTEFHAIFSIVAQMMLEEKHQYQQYDRNLERGMRRSLIIGGALAFTVLLILSALYWNLHKEILARQKVEKELAESVMTAKAAQAKAEEANRQKSRVLGFVSHDFKNPLAALKRFVDMLEKDSAGLTETQHETVGYIAEGIQNLRDMVTDILDKARLEEGKLTPSLTWIQIQAFMDELKPSIFALAEPQHIKVSIDIREPLQKMEADPKFLRQIIINLLSNAIKYNKPDGQVFLEFRKMPEQPLIRIQVRDTGIGIAPDKIPELFSPYFRVGGQNYNAVEGSGLGLAFIKKLTETQGGYITVESQEGEGSTFTVFLPQGALPLKEAQLPASQGINPFFWPLFWFG